MDLEEFINKLKTLAPSKKKLIERGYSESYSEEAVENFYLLKNSQSIKVENSLNDFLFNYNKIEIRNLSFKDEVQVFGNFTSIAGIEGGYLVVENYQTPIYALFSDEEENIQLFCENENDFFEILIILADFSSNVISGKIKPFDEEIRFEYLNKLNFINPLFDFDILL